MFQMLCEERYFPRPHRDYSADLDLRHSKFIHQLMLPLSCINVAGMVQGKETDYFHCNNLPRYMNSTAWHSCDSTAVPPTTSNALNNLSSSAGGSNCLRIFSEAHPVYILEKLLGKNKCIDTHQLKT